MKAGALHRIGRGLPLRRRTLGGLRAGQGGVAAMEFAFVAPVLLTMLGGLADFGLAFADRLQLEQGVADGAAYAFVQQQGVGPLGSVSANGVKSATLAAIALSGVTVSVTGPQSACTQTSGTSTTLVAQSYGTQCPNGNPVGTYITITAQYTYQPMLPLYSQLSTTALSATAIVRLY